MKNRLIIVEGLPCSGKSSVSAFAASVLRGRQARELRMLPSLPLDSVVIDNPQRDWAAAHE